AEVADLLARYLAHLEDPDRVPPPPAVRGVRVKGRRRVRRVAAATVALVAIAALGVVGYRVLRPAEENPAAQAPAEPTPVEKPAAGWKPPTVEELAGRPSPLDGRKGEAVPQNLLKLAGGGDPARVPAELVAVLGNTPRFRLPKEGPNSGFVHDREG